MQTVDDGWNKTRPNLQNLWDRGQARYLVRISDILSPIAVRDVDLRAVESWASHCYTEYTNIKQNTQTLIFYMEHMIYKISKCSESLTEYVYKYCYF